MTKKIVIGLICLFVVSLIGAGIVYATNEDADLFQTITVNKEKSYSIENVNKIKIGTASADLKIHLVDGDEVSLKYHGKINCLLCNINNKLETNKKGDTITFEPSSNYIGLVVYSNLIMDLYLPKEYQESIIIDVMSSDIYLENLSLKKLSIETVSGDIELKDIITKEELSLNTVSGDIELEKISANIVFDTTSGNVEAWEIAGNFIGETVSGDVEVSIINDNFITDIATVSGDVIVALKENVDFDFTINTVSGDIEIKYRYLVNKYNDDDKVAGTVGNDSNNNVKIKTISGDILLK